MINALRHPTQTFYGWRMLALVSFMGAVNNGFFSKGAALFLVPVETSLGLNRATTSLIFALARSEGAVEGPVIGYLADRYGSRKLLIIGTALTGIGFLVFASASSVWTFAIAYLLFISLGATMAFQHATKTAVNMWFSRFRVRAMSIQEATGNLGSMLLVPLLGLIIALHSWQAAAVLAGLAYLFIVLPLSPLLKESPESIGLLPDGATLEQVAAARQAASRAGSSSARQMLQYYDSHDFSLKEALCSPTYWLLLLGTLFRQVAKAPVQVHIVAILQWKGLDTATAGLVFAFWLGMNVPSKLFFGFIGDRAPAQVSLGGGMLLYALAMVLLLYGGSIWICLLAAILGGMAEGITPINWGAIGNYFGRRYFATLRGIINLSHSWALLLMPWAAGWWFDRHGSYDMTLVVSFFASLLAAVTYGVMRRPKAPRAAGAGPSRDFQTTTP